MRTCQQCGEIIPAGARSCNMCGADLSGERPFRFYIVSALALAAIISAAALLHSYLQNRVIRPPTDFLPDSTRAVIDVDVRPQSPSALLLESNWPVADREVLASRSKQLAQAIVNWTGLELDIEQDAAPWFGGEVLTALVPVRADSAPNPRDLVVIARTTDHGATRRNLDNAVKSLSKEAGWQRSTLRSNGHAITIWGPAGGASEIAYVVVDGCVLISPTSDALELCLQAAANPSHRLVETERFKYARGELPGNAFVWCYATASDLWEIAVRVLPEIRHGWRGLLRSIAVRRTWNLGSDPAPFVRRLTGSVAAVVTPEKDGLRLHACYWHEAKGYRPASSAEETQLTHLVPRDAVAFVLLHELRSVLAPLVPPDPARRRPVHLRGIFPGPLGMFLEPERLPETALVAVLPRETEQKPAIAVAFSGDTTNSIGRLTGFFQGVTGRIEKATVFATDEEGIRQFRAAARATNDRLNIESNPEFLLQVWLRPNAISTKFSSVGEASLDVRRNASGGEAELYLKTMPSQLLGGD